MFSLFCIYTRNGILEGRLCGVVDKLVCSFIITTDSLHESLFVIFKFYTMEWHRIVRCVIRFKKWIYSLFYILIIKHTNFIFVLGAKLAKKDVILLSVIENLTNITLLFGKSSFFSYLLNSFSRAGIKILSLCKCNNPSASRLFRALEMSSLLSLSSFAIRVILMWNIFSPPGRTHRASKKRMMSSSMFLGGTRRALLLIF